MAFVGNVLLDSKVEIQFANGNPVSIVTSVQDIARSYSRVTEQHPSQTMVRNDVTQAVTPFKDQDSANFVKTQLKNLSLKLQTTVQPVFFSRKIGQHLQECENKPQVVNQQYVVYQFQCNLCDTGSYVGYTRSHLQKYTWMAARVLHLLYASITIKTTWMLPLRTSLAALECWRNA